jgi:hypothetical protein
VRPGGYGLGSQIGSDLLGISSVTPAGSCQIRERELDRLHKLLWSNAGKESSVARTVQGTARIHVGIILPENGDW